MSRRQTCPWPACDPLMTRYHDEVHGDLFTQVDKTIDLLLAKYLKASISYEGVQRVETFPVPESALREVLQCRYPP